MFQNFLVSSFFMNRSLGVGGVASLFHRNTSVSQDRKKKRRKGTLLCFRIFLLWKKSLWVGGDGRGITFSVEDFLTDNFEKIRRGTLLCFKKFLVWQNFRDMRGGGITIFRRNFSVSPCRKNS